MLAVKKILHPTDFSEHSAYAFKISCALAKACGAKIAVLYVKDPPGICYAEFAAIPTPTEDQETLLNKLTAIRPKDPQLTVEHHLTVGTPADEILRYCEKLDAELIVMGSHGRGALGRLLLGSVAEKVARNAKCPVLTIRHPAGVGGLENRRAAAKRQSDGSIRQLAQCPYCAECEAALDANMALVFNPDGSSHEPCEHVVWIEGRYSEWAQQQGVDRLIGSTEFRWLHPALDDVQDDEDMNAYIQELATLGLDWEFAPKAACDIKSINTDRKTTDAKGKAHVEWEVDGFAIFAPDAQEVAVLLPECRDRTLAGFKDG